MVVHSVGGQAPYLLQNRTTDAVLVRQSDSNDTWKVLERHTAMPFAWPDAAGELTLLSCFCNVQCAWHASVGAYSV